MFRNNQNGENKRLTITTLKTAVECNKTEQIRQSLTRYGLPKSDLRITDYLILQNAVSRNKTQIAKLLINAGCRINPSSNDTDSTTPLAYSIKNENEEIASLLLKKGAKLSSKANFYVGDEKTTVLHLAAKEKSLKMLKLLIENFEVDINLVSNGKTSFQVFLENHNVTSENKDAELIRMFLSKGARIDFKTSNGKTVLHHVIKTAQNDIIKHVIKHTNDVNEQCSNNKNTVLHNLLNGSKATDEKILQVVKWLLSKGAKVNIQDNLGNTVCHLAAQKKYLQVLQVFLQNEWNVNCCNQQGNTVLHFILSNDPALHENMQYRQIVNHILKQDSLLLPKNNLGKTPLHLAAEYRQSQVLNDMLSKSADINDADNYGNTVLYLFLENIANRNLVPVRDDIELVKKMISLGANPAAFHPSSKLTPLHLALKLRVKEIILCMLEGKFNFDGFDKIYNRSILHLLCCCQLQCIQIVSTVNAHVAEILNSTEIDEKNNAEIAAICIKKGATINIRDSELKTPLYWAVLMGRKNMVETLLRNGANPNLVDKNGRTILENLMKNKENAVNFYGQSIPDLPGNCTSRNIKIDCDIALMLLSKNAVAEKLSNGQVSLFHYCAAKSYLEMLLKIIPYSKDPNIRDSHQNTILHALLNCNSNENEDVAKKVADIVAVLLLKKTYVNAVNAKGETPLHLAAKSKHLKVTKMLLKKKAIVADSGQDGNTVLHFLCMLRFNSTAEIFRRNYLIEKALAKLFISKGCDINAKNKKGLTPLLLAAQTNSSSMTSILLKLGAKIDCVDGENQSMPIHLAAENNHKKIIEKLIQFGADVNVRRGDRKTPLHIVVTHELPEITKLLLERGADTDLKDNQGKTPLHWACWYENLDNINELLEYGADVNIEDNFCVTPIILSQQSNNALIKLRYHAAKLDMADMFLSRRNEDYMEKFNEEYKHYPDAMELIEFESTALQELLKMKNVLITPCTSLADVLLMSANKLSLFKCNEDFQKLLNSDDFQDKFPIYADLVRACYRKGIIRSDLMESAKEAFRRILGLPLPDTCCDAIFDYLDNENLNNLAKASEVVISKRKRFLDEICDGPPTKKMRRMSV